MYVLQEHIFFLVITQAARCIFMHPMGSLEVPKYWYNDANSSDIIPQIILATRISRQDAVHKQETYLCLTIFARLFFKSAVVVSITSDFKIILLFSRESRNLA